MKSTYIFALSALLLLSALTVTAQSSFRLDPKVTTFIDNAVMECIYKYTINAPLRDSVDKQQKETYITILQANGSVSKFWDWHLFKNDSIICTSVFYPSSDSIKKLDWKYNFSVKNIFTPVVFKSYPKDKMTVTDDIIPSDYIYEESKTERNWTLKDDTLTVCGYQCNKAITTFGGREWTAWYAPEITLSEGPWKLYGLPGLILKAEDATGTHNFEAIVIRKSNRPIYLTKNFTQIKIGKELFIKNKNKFEEDPKGNLDLLPGISIVNFRNGSVLANGKRCSLKRQTKYCPLELE